MRPKHVIMFFVWLLFGFDLAIASATLHALSKTEAAALKTLSRRYQTAPLISMRVTKVLKLGLLGQERRSTGKAWISQGKLRMELDGAEKSLLVLNRTELWAVSYPKSELKGALPQVIKGEIRSKEVRAQALLGVLGSEGLLKEFSPTGVMTESGSQLFFLLPKDQKNDSVKRLQLRLSTDGKSIVGLRFWDDRENETNFEFSEVEFSKKEKAKSHDELFKFVPPADADVMKM